MSDEATTLYKENGVAVGKLRSAFIRQPFPHVFSRILTVLLTYVDRRTLQAWPSQKRLAGHVGCSEKTVKRNLQAARNLGLLKLESVGAAEMRLRVNSRKHLPSNHRFTFYTIEMTHPLWRGENLLEALEVIRHSTHKGIEQRCQRPKGQPKPEAVSGASEVLITDSDLEELVHSLEDGTGRNEVPITDVDLDEFVQCLGDGTGFSEGDGYVC